jgi:LDH2 family malate/lactate/ureidoglycolate dehydrogenase
VPTDDPNAAAHQGLIQPLGGYKGYGLSLLIDILTGALSGGGFSTQVKTLYKDIAIPSQVAHTFAAIHVGAFMALDEFRQRMDAIIQLMRLCPTAKGVEQILVPGEIEHQAESRRKVEGIPINPALREELAGLAKDLGVSAACL